MDLIIDKKEIALYQSRELLKERDCNTTIDRYTLSSWVTDEENINKRVY